MALTYTTSAARPDYLQEYALNYDVKDNDWVAAEHRGLRVRRACRYCPQRVPGLRGRHPGQHGHDPDPSDLADRLPLPLPYAPVKLTVANSTVSRDQSDADRDRERQSDELHGREQGGPADAR